MSALMTCTLAEPQTTFQTDSDREVSEMTPQARRKANPQLADWQQKLAADYVPLAMSLCRNMKRNWPTFREEFESAALYALVDCARIFEPARGIKFATFARVRIVGALRDVQRELLDLIGWTADGTEVPAMASLIPTMEEQGQILGLRPSTEIGFELEMVEATEAILKKLPKRHADACRLLYLRGLNQDQAARELGCSKSRISVLFQQSIEFLNSACKEQLEYGDPSDN